MPEVERYKYVIRKYIPENHTLGTRYQIDKSELKSRINVGTLIAYSLEILVAELQGDGFVISTNDDLVTTISPRIMTGAWEVPKVVDIGAVVESPLSAGELVDFIRKARAKGCYRPGEFKEERASEPVTLGDRV